MKIRIVGIAISIAAIVAAIVAIVAATTTSHANRPATRPAAKSAPACVTQASTPDVVQMCGHCRVIRTADAAARDKLMDALRTGAEGREVWLAIGDRWVAGDDSTTFFGASACQAQMGGYLVRYSG